MKHYPATRAPVRVAQDNGADLQRTIVQLTRTNLVLLILTSIACGVFLTAWAIAAYQIAHPPIL